MKNEKEKAELLFALDQKTALLTRVADLTKQIEVRSRQKEIRLEDLPARRQVLLDRVERCNRMIGRCADSLDKEPQGRLRQILGGKLSPRECSGEEAVLLQRSVKCLSLLRSILAENEVAVVRVRSERDRLRNRLNDLRSSGAAAGGSMFHPDGSKGLKAP